MIGDYWKLFRDGVLLTCAAIFLTMLGLGAGGAAPLIAPDVRATANATVSEIRFPDGDPFWRQEVYYVYRVGSETYEGHTRGGMQGVEIGDRLPVIYDRNTPARHFVDRAAHPVPLRERLYDNALFLIPSLVVMVGLLMMLTGALQIWREQARGDSPAVYRHPTL